MLSFTHSISSAISQYILTYHISTRMRRGSFERVPDETTLIPLEVQSDRFRVTNRCELAPSPWVQTTVAMREAPIRMTVVVQSGRRPFCPSPPFTLPSLSMSTYTLYFKSRQNIIHLVQSGRYMPRSFRFCKCCELRKVRLIGFSTHPDTKSSYLHNQT